MDIQVQSNCGYCDVGAKYFYRREATSGRLMHVAGMTPDGRVTMAYCNNEDEECRRLGEPLGYYVFAWWPRLCRNNKLRWLTWVERHGDGTYTLGNRAH